MTKNHTNLPYRTNTQCIMVYNILCTKAQTVINNLDYCTNYYHNYFIYKLQKAKQNICIFTNSIHNMANLCNLHKYRCIYLKLTI